MKIDMDSTLIVFEKIAIMGKAHAIIHIPEVAFDTKLFFDEMVKGIEVYIGEELGSEIANRESFAIFAPIRKDDVCQAENLRVLDLASDELKESFLINTGKVLVNVGFVEPAVFSQKNCARRMAA